MSEELRQIEEENKLEEYGALLLDHSIRNFLGLSTPQSVYDHIYYPERSRAGFSRKAYKSLLSRFR